MARVAFSHTAIRHLRYDDRAVDESTPMIVNWTPADIRAKANVREGIARADTLAELADAAGIDREGLLSTVDAYNAAVDESRDDDFGRERVTGNSADRFRFRVLSLRNVALTAPYMHDGSETTLDGVVEFYNKGGVANNHLSAEIRPSCLPSV